MAERSLSTTGGRAFVAARSPILREPLNVLALTLITAFAVCAVLAPFLAPYDPLAQTLSSRLEPPSAAHWLGTNQLGLDIHGYDPAGPPGNLNAVRHFTTPSDLRHEIINARLWAGLHYRFSSVAGVAVGRAVAKYDLRHAFRPVG